MGFGVPSALGAKLGQPDQVVIDIDGDGSFMMTQTEMATCAEFDIRVKILLLNNDFQGMVRQWQDLFYEERYSGTEMVNPDFVKLAEAMHCAGLRCRTRKGAPPSRSTHRFAPPIPLRPTDPRAALWLQTWWRR
jgi:acetolactate synthase-1/2/3 large subunit|eukprot:COSAG06_NODE_7747_length_2391_cov_1.627400_2_plen_134_part_00